MTKRFLSAAVAAAALIAVPTMAQADSHRASAPVSEESNLGGGFSVASLGFLAAAAAIVVGTIIVTANDDDDNSVSA